MAIRTYAEATAIPTPAIYGLRQFFRFITPTPPQDETQDARRLYPSLLDHDDPAERDHAQRSTRLSSRGTETLAAQPAELANDRLATDNAGLRNLWWCCPATPDHTCLSATRDDNVSRWRVHCGEHILYDCLNGAELRRAREPVTPQLAASPPSKQTRIREISDEELCPQCQCLLSRSEINQKKVGRECRGRCSNCYLRAPAPVEVSAVRLLIPRIDSFQPINSSFRIALASS